MARYDSRADFKVHEMKSMGKARDSEALELLRRISHQVQPIMRRREWRVPLLSEFFPANANLLGLNIGGGGGRTREIKVRLRPARDPDSFLPYESILGTMLHELVHNVRGPHDSAFYKLLDEITAECEELMARGVGGTGVGFDGPSCGRLGSHAFIPLHNPAPGRLRESALKAAEERAKRQRIMPAGPCRLGGSDGAAVRYATPAAAAAAAAERRCSDNRWCPCERLVGALSRAVAKAEAQRAQQQGRQQQGRTGGDGGVADATAGDVAHGARGGAVGGSAGSARSASAEEVEADLVRRIEDGVVDLTLDSDDDAADEGAGEEAVPRGPQPAGPGAGPPAGPRPGTSSAAAADATGGSRGGGAAPTAAVGPLLAGQPGREREFGDSADGFRSGDAHAGKAGCPGPGPSSNSNSRAVQCARMKQEAADVEPGRSAGTAERRLLAGGMGGSSGDGNRSHSGSGSGPASRRTHVVSGKGAAAPVRLVLEDAGPRCAPPAVVGPSAPAPRPPLQVLQTRNPAAAAAAAAALARIQQSQPQPQSQSRQQEVPHKHEMQRRSSRRKQEPQGSQPLKSPPQQQEQERGGQPPHHHHEQQQVPLAQPSLAVRKAQGRGRGAAPHSLALPGGQDTLARALVGGPSGGDGGDVIDLTDD